jgi:hypothetical protein
MSLTVSIRSKQGLNMQSDKQMGRDPINSITMQLFFIMHGYLNLQMTHHNTVMIMYGYRWGSIGDWIY